MQHLGLRQSLQVQRQQQQGQQMDSRGAEAAEGIVYNVDAEGASVRNRLWRGNFVTDFDGVERRLDRLEAEFRPRPDDVFIMAYLKCGTNWLHDICSFVLSGQCERRPPPKLDAMLELQDLQHLDTLPSPRVLNCHLPYDLIPRQMLHSKMVYSVRNPKDTAVSLYNHYVGITDYEYCGTFKGFLGLFVEGKLDGGSYFHHLRSFLSALRSGQHSNILLVEYERLKSDTEAEVARIHRFLKGGDAELPQQLLEGICRRVSFSEMQRDRGGDCREIFNDSNSTGFFRKGEVGDWRNWFSDEDSRRVEQMFHEQLGEFADLFTPTYSLTH